MGDFIKITFNLTLLCALAGLVLSATWAKTDPVRQQKEALEREIALKRLMPGAESIEPVRDVVIAGRPNVIYKATKGDETLGYVVTSVGKGYSSYVKLLVSVGMDYRVLGIDILGHSETPGLGDEIEQDWFKEQFKGKAPKNLVVAKGETETDIQAVTGATISSRAVAKAARDAVEALAMERDAGL